MSSFFQVLGLPNAKNGPDKSLRRLAVSVLKLTWTVLQRVDSLRDSHFRGQVLLRLQRLDHDLRELSQGRIVFDSTETWRVTYEDVLAACKAKRYLSVALVRTEDYWCGLPGERSVSFNGTLVQYGFYVHRIFIVDDFLWPLGAALPADDIYSSMTRQFAQGIQIGVVRLSELFTEPDLVADFGIYGTTAVGYQVTDESGQTIRYEMRFGEEHVRVAEDRWRRLSLYIRTFESL